MTIPGNRHGRHPTAFCFYRVAHLLHHGIVPCPLPPTPDAVPITSMLELVSVAPLCGEVIFTTGPLMVVGKPSVNAAAENDAVHSASTQTIDNH